VYRGGGVIGNFNLSSMITYYFIITVLNRILAHPAFWVADMVERGELSTFLVKPFPFLGYVFIHSLTRRVVNLVISVPVLMVALLLLRQYLILPPNLITVILFGFSCVLAVAIYFLLGLLLGLVSLWTLEIGSIIYFYYEALGFLGGAMLPLSFFPSSVSGILIFLPFKYLYYFPAQLYLGNISLPQIFSGLLVGTVWIVILYLAIALVFNYGLRRYSSFGN
jgi:ABC-2 type transport system permease protein